MLLGLSGAQLVMLGTAVSVAVVAEYAAGAARCRRQRPGLAALLRARAGLGRRSPARGVGADRRRTGRHDGSLRRTDHLARPMRREPGDVLVLPGIPGTLSVVSSAATGAVYVADPRSGTVTAILELRGRGFILEDPGEQDRRVGGWGSVLASLCQQPDIVRIQVLHRTSRGGAAGAHRWWAEHALTDAPFASRIVADLLADAEETTDRQECLLAVAVRAPRGRGRGRDTDWSGIDQQVAALTDALHATDLDVQGPVTPRRLSALLRAAYDPETSYLPDRADGDRLPGVGVGGADGGGRVLGPAAHRLRAPRRLLGGRSGRAATSTPRSCDPLLLAPGARRSLHPDRRAARAREGVARDPPRQGRAHRGRRAARPHRAGRGRLDPGRGRRPGAPRAGPGRRPR